MKTSYAVKWREPDGRTCLGRLELATAALVLEGRNGAAGVIRRTIPFTELHGCRVGRQPQERLDGRPTLVVEHPGGDFVIASAVTHAGVVQELAQRLAELRS